MKISYLLMSLLLMSSLISCGKSNSSDTATAEVTAPSHPGAALYKANCKVCHAGGINGAPILGNIKMWGPRLGQGKETLVSHAINGFGLMPAKGGKTHLTDDQIATIVDYMIQEAK